MESNAPRDNLVRALIDTEAAHLRADNGSEGRTLHGRFAVFNRWTRISSVWEGEFMERIAPGAFAKTFEEHRDRIKVLYDHGRDPQIGNKPLGPIRALGEDTTGAAYEVDLIRASYNDDFIIPAAEAGLLGASFRFSIPEGGDEWITPERSTQGNPDKLPERTITQAEVYEFGPVTFPAYADATAGVRSGTDNFLDSLIHDPRFMARFIERAGLTVVQRILDDLPPTAQVETEPATPPVEQREQEDDSADGQSPPSPSTAAERKRLARQIEAERLGVGRKETQ